MSKDFEQAAHDKGEHDSSKSREHTGFVDVICGQIFGGSYNPPSGHEDAYKAGWGNDQQQSRK